jgi:hypothetical protein
VCEHAMVRLRYHVSQLLMISLMLCGVFGLTFLPWRDWYGRRTDPGLRVRRWASPWWRLYPCQGRCSCLWDVRLLRLGLVTSNRELKIQ